MESKHSFVYLGTEVADDGRVGNELHRRLGKASADFRGLQKIWGHTSICVQWKLELYNAVLVSKLLYSLSAIWLNASERRQLDGLHCRHLRRIAGIGHPMLTRISNEEVRRRTNNGH